MGKKQPAAAARKQRPGADITRFLEPRTCPADAGTRHTVSAGGRHSAGIQTAAERTSTPRKHLLDNVLLSQDADDGGMHVVWASSPAAALSPQKGGFSQEALSSSQPPDNSQTSKEGFRKTLIQAVQRAPSESEQLFAEHGQHPAGTGGGVLLEQLLARRGSHRAASTSAPGEPAAQQEAPAAKHGAPVPSLRGQYSSHNSLGEATAGRLADVDDDQVMQDVLASTEPYKTPATARPAATVLTSQSGDGTRSSLRTPSALTVGGKRTLSHSGKKTVSGHKRRALLDLLDQVNLVFKHRPSNAGDLEVPPQPQLDAATARESSVTAGGKQQVAEVVGPAVTSLDQGTDLEQFGSLEPSTIGETLPGMATLGTSGPPATPVGAAAYPATQPIGQDWSVAAASHRLGVPPPASWHLTANPQDPGYAMPPPAVGAAVHTTPAAAPSLQTAGTASTPFDGLRPSLGRPAQPYEAPTRSCDPTVEAADRSSRPPPAPFHRPAQGQGQGQGPVRPHQMPSAVCPPLAFERRDDASSVAGGYGNSVQGVRQGVPPAVERPPAAPPPCVHQSSAVDDDDDEVWGDVDIDALVAHVTSREKSPVREVVAPVSASTRMHSPAAGRRPGVVAASEVSTPQLQQQRHTPADRQPLQPIQTVPQPAAPAIKAPDSLPVQGKPDASRAAATPLLGDREATHLVVLEVDSAPADHFKVLRCYNEYQGMDVRVCLRDMWVDQHVDPGDTVNVVGGRSLPNPTCTTYEVTASEGLLIVHPDILLSGTSVCTAIRCTRQAWLQERVAGGPSGEKALLGSMMHELLQRSLRAALTGKLNRDEMIAEARSILSSNTDKLLECQQDEISALSYLSHQLDALIAWCKSYVAPNPVAPLGGRLDALGNGPPTYCRVNDVVDIEESIWAPKYGLKGQLDATLRVSLSTKDPLHNQLTLTGGYVSTKQQQRMMQEQQGPMQSTSVFHGRRQENVGHGGARSGKEGSHSGMRPQQQHHWSAGVVAPGTGGGGPNHIGVQYTGTGQRGGTALPGDVTAETLIVPFEFKTGKDSHEHRAQVLLYLLLMEDRYNTAIKTGLLWNSNKPVMQAVHYAHHELASLIMHRNRLAAYLVGAARNPPPPLKEPESDRKCNYCSVSATCALYLAVSAHGQGCGSGDATAMVQQQAAELSPVLREKLDMIPPASAAFFAHWIRLVDVEEQTARGNRADVWAISGAQREQQGGCIADLVFEREQLEQQDSDGKRFLYVFKRPLASARGGGGDGAAVGHNGNGGVPSLRPAGVTSWRGRGGAEGEEREDGVGTGLLCAGFTAGDMGLLGVEGRHAAVARVIVVEVSKDTITLSTRKELKVDKLSGPTLPLAGPGCQRLQSPGGRPPAHPSGPDAPNPSSAITWRLDHDESATVFSQMRLNLALLGVPGAASGWQTGCRNGGTGDATEARREGHLMRLRKLVIDLEPPQQGLMQHNNSSQLTGSMASSQVVHGNPYLRDAAHSMNGEQLEAVQRVLAMQDYAILLGMPGTGKTTTIVHIIRALVEQHGGGCTVLVASYTNSAVDNILLKLVGTPVSFVRIGSAGAVHPNIRPYMPGGAAHPNTSVEGLRDTMARVNVVGCTCLSIHSPLLAGRSFGVCILDEASQVTLPASIGALALARSFLLVGDHYQLSPLVVSREAAQGGLGVSLFRRLSEAHPQAVVTLRSQYRMASDIMALSNTLVYNGRMLCGNEAVANGTLRLPHLPALHSYGPPATSAPTTAALGSPRSAWPVGLAVPGWLLHVLQPESRVVFLDTDGAAGCRELTLKDGLVNPGEVRLVRALASALVAAGLPAGNIGVASPYKAQVSALQGALADLDDAAGGVSSQAPSTATSKAAVEVLTVDKYQGRDKPAILLSFVRCNAHRSAGRLLTDWQRLNVGLTRARTKLLLVGSAATLASIPMLGGLLALLRRNGSVVQLPVDCLSALPPVPSAAP